MPIAPASPSAAVFATISRQKHTHIHSAVGLIDESASKSAQVTSEFDAERRDVFNFIPPVGRKVKQTPSCP
ncbi:unnamed protein product [Protopolystoma xenopodis]|uniref:Uncharacterized protein n=1 Tax=Protopolystoma xenopodis TaxID=117903 RepID=A0A448XMF8_9PLAT|nr:unnamed protein product [Protopolystoma xenopodis]